MAPNPYEQDVCANSWVMAWRMGLKAVIRRLDEKGYDAHAPTLGGRGQGAMRLEMTHQKCVDSVVTYIREHKLEDAILVGHSFGGPAALYAIFSKEGPDELIPSAPYLRAFRACSSSYPGTR